MKHFYRLNGWQWFGVILWTGVFSLPHRDDSISVMLLRILFSFAIGYCLTQWFIQQRRFPLTLMVKTSGAKGGPPEDQELFEKLHRLFKATFPKGNPIEFGGFDCNDEQVWFYFKGADPDVIMKSIQPLLRDVSLPEGSHLIVATGPNQTKELPVFATI